MKTYKDFPKICLGYSDWSAVILRGYSGVKELGFSDENNYYAHFVTERIDIGKLGPEFRHVMTCKSVLWIYDDERRTVCIDAPEISVYVTNDDVCVIYAPGGVRVD